MFHHRGDPINAALGSCTPVPIRDSLHAKARTIGASQRDQPSSLVR